MALHGADPTLTALLRDVLDEQGLALCPPGEEGRARVMVALASRGEPLEALVARARRWAQPLVLLLPFNDARLVEEGMRLGARACFPLGTPLEGLRRLLTELARGCA